ncbi:MAG TPA: OmpA family protein [Oligoflexia bacterium]|nr:OmpA family protein [Oligoflexia bacterium]HMP27177.1 OmpA family protein [Oligoflexia bacterium]
MTRQILSFTSFLIVLSLFLAACSASNSGKNKSGSGAERDLLERDLDQNSRYGDGSIPIASEGGIFRDIRFAFDSAQIGDEARQNIEYNFQVLRQYPDINLTLEGHADERGTNEYNLALGAERAKAVENVMLSLGFPRSRMKVISYGEEVPLNTAHNEDAWAENRRVHFAANRSEDQRY